MFALSLAILAAHMMAAAASAHFVFVVPDEDGRTARVVMSETLEPDDRVDSGMLDGLKLSIRDMTGKTTDLAIGPVKDNALTLQLPGHDTRVIQGKIDLGFMQRGRSAPHVLIYHPKTIVGDAFDAAATIINHPVIELIPVGKPGAVRFQLNIQGKPAPKTQVVVVLPDGTEKRVVTGDDGRTDAFEQYGNYGVWARYWDETPGQRDGKKYEQVRHYATLVATVNKAE